MNQDRMGDYYGSGISNCCEAPIIHGDICSHCKEHCVGLDELDESPATATTRRYPVEPQDKHNLP